MSFDRLQSVLLPRALVSSVVRVPLCSRHHWYVSWGLAENNITKPMPIQAQALPLVLSGYDVIQGDRPSHGLAIHVAVSTVADLVSMISRSVSWHLKGCCIDACLDADVIDSCGIS